jgi:hypothetical protein
MFEDVYKDMPEHLRGSVRSWGTLSMKITKRIEGRQAA